MATTYYNDIQKLYVAYFNRPADPSGLAFWEKQLEDKKATLNDIAKAFSQTDEYKATFTGMTNDAIVKAIYQNLFNRAPDDEGLAFWTARLNAKDVTVDYAVQTIAGAAKNTAGASQDLTILNNKIAASGQFTAALDTPAEQAGYTTASASLAKTWLGGINTDVSLVNATTPGALNAIVGQVVAKGTPFSLQTSLSNINAAQAVVDAFVKATVTTDVNGDGAKNAADIPAAQVKALAAVAGDMTGGAAGTTGTLFSSTTSQAVRDALVAAQQATNAAALNTAQATLDADNAKISKVAGLADAVTILNAAVSAQKAAVSAEAAAKVDMTAKEAVFGINNGGGSTVAPSSDGKNLVFTNASGTVVKLADIGTNGQATLTSGVDATKYTGLTELIASYNAEATALSNLTKANTNVDNANLMVNMLDVAPDAAGKITVGATDYTEAGLIKAIADMINATNDPSGATKAVATGATPTLAQIQTELAVLQQTSPTQYASFKALVDAETKGLATSAASTSTTLGTATTALNNAKATQTADKTAADNAQTAYTTAATKFEGGSDVTVSSGKLVFTDTTSTVVTLATIDATTGKATIAGTVTETTNPGVTALITKFNANVDAQAKLPGDATAVSTAQSTYDTAKLAADAAAAKVLAFNPLTSTQAADTKAVSDANDAITKLAKDVAALKTADANVATLNGDVAAVTAYSDALKAAGYVVTTLDAAHSGLFTQFGTANSDVYLVGTLDAKIAAFGLQGTDALSVGSGYTLVKGAMGAKGVTANDAALEIFVSNNAAGDAVIQIEQHAFSSNVSTTAGEVVTITLTGVDANTLVLNNGIITVTH